MQRLAQTLIVALLVFNASGAYTLVAEEPCDISEQSSRDDDACPPMCVTCGCCVQAVEPVTLSVAAEPDTPVAAIDFLFPPVPKTTPRDILHVPKPRFA